MKKISVKIYAIAAVIVILVIVMVIGFIFPFGTADKKPVLTAAHPPKFAYKISIDSLGIVYGKVSGNQSLSTLLSPFVPGAVIDRIARETKDQFDVRKIRTGNTFARIVTRDSAARTLFFIYEINPIDFVVYDLRDSLRVYKDKKKVTRLIRTSGGTIKSSLWNCFVENRLDVGLGIALSDVYAWTVDFYGLQKGDHFTVMYEEVFVDNVMIGIDRILAATFFSNDKEFRAYYFEQDGKGQYFDENGLSLQRSFLKAPLKFSRISSRFTRSRMHPILRIARPHYGVDYAAPRGTPVVALGDGTVDKAGYHGGYGRLVGIRHNSLYATTYAHLSGYAKGIRPGVRVHQGEVIGYVGSSGLSTGAHLDFRVYKNGQPTDPLKLESPASKPVDPENIPQYREVVLKMDKELTSPPGPISKK
jgi:murein DD-endopeptidase MepM/ murein hydrolase activator NlpD